MSTLINPYNFGSGGAQATVIGYSHTTSSNVTLHASTAVGDFCIISSLDSSGGTLTGGAGGWSGGFPDGQGGRFYYKNVAAGDLGVALNPDATRGGIITVTFRGATAATRKTFGSDSPSNTLTLSGFTRDAAHKGLWSIGSSSSVLPAPPSGWTAGGGTSGSLIMRTGVLTDNSYVSGSSITWTYSGSDNVWAYVLELT